MASDFVKLVSQANPASRQYGAPGESYDPPSHSYSRSRGGPANEPQLLDPFFDDDDEDVSGGLTATGHSGGGGGGRDDDVETVRVAGGAVDGHVFEVNLKRRKVG